MVDTLWLFGTQGCGHKLRLFEDVASLEFDGKSQTDDAGVARGPGVTPEDANARGYYGCCTVDNVKGTDAKVWGFGNGARRIRTAPGYEDGRPRRSVGRAAGRGRAAPSERAAGCSG